MNTLTPEQLSSLMEAATKANREFNREVKAGITSMPPETHSINKASLYFDDDQIVWVAIFARLILLDAVTKTEQLAEALLRVRHDCFTGAFWNLDPTVDYIDRVLAGVKP